MTGLRLFATDSGRAVLGLGSWAKSPFLAGRLCLAGLCGRARLWRTLCSRRSSETRAELALPPVLGLSGHFCGSGGIRLPVRPAGRVEVGEQAGVHADRRAGDRGKRWRSQRLATFRAIPQNQGPNRSALRSRSSPVIALTTASWTASLARSSEPSTRAASAVAVAWCRRTSSANGSLAPSSAMRTRSASAAGPSCGCATPYSAASRSQG